MPDFDINLVPLIIDLDPEEEARARQRVIRRIPDESDRLAVLQALGLEDS